MNHAEDQAPAESGESSTNHPDAPPPDQENSLEGAGPWRSALRDIAPYLDLGWRLAGVAAFPPLIGAGIDVQFQTTPWGLFIGAAIGLVGAGLQLRRLQQEFRS
ncbi:AtpZ/AtpI family protein [Salinibacter grassmerensis]|uniref:AtpZ/AtpI family protein n=1 Tax=Salinibacter grassmerensis TaxID=3040353 RepID=UPI0021E94C7A|nr:AtpZ/AtpI family protein [Salinibacter grassmerensis]